jgi:hypothetical protein
MSKDAYLKKRLITIEHGGETYYARTLVGENLEEILKLDGNESLEGVRASCLVCCRCACGADGVRVFTDDELQMVRTEVDFAITSAVAKAVMEASGLGDDEPGKD